MARPFVMVPGQRKEIGVVKLIELDFKKVLINSLYRVGRLIRHAHTMLVEKMRELIAVDQHDLDIRQGIYIFHGTRREM